MTQATKTIREINRVGGHPAVDFINTVHSRFADDGREYLKSYPDLVDWNLDAGFLSRRQSAHFKQAADARPREAEKMLDAALELRESLYRLFLAVVRGKTPAGWDLAELNKLLKCSAGFLLLDKKAGALNWAWHLDPEELDSILCPVAKAGADLLTSDKLDRLKECPAPDGCGWLFIDTSRNRSRQWCSMKDCGNAAKVRRFRKHQAQQKGGA